MKITIENTDRLVEIVIDGRAVPARVWHGYTKDGVEVVCLITRIVPVTTKPEDHQQFADELREVAPALPEAMEIFPLRMIL